ncbi:MAG: hypothetical protein ACYC0X_33035 [Pirellulaceae bacterium]
MDTRTHKLNYLWSEWTGVVDDIVRRKRRVARVTDEAYHKLHRDLLAEINEQVNRCKSAQYSLPKEMLRLASPWLTLDSLLGADKHVLAVLRTQVKQAESRLLHRTNRRRWVFVAIPLAIAVISGLAVTIIIPLFESGEVGQTVRQWQHSAYRLQLAIVKTSLLTKIGVFALIVVAMGTLLLRSMRQD